MMKVDDIIIFSIAVIFIASLSWLLGVADGIEEMRDKAIEKDYAEYHQTTGKWQWKEK